MPTSERLLHMSVATRFEPQRLHDVAQLGALSAQPLPCSHGEWAQPRPTSKRYCIESKGRSWRTSLLGAKLRLSGQLRRD